jgi:hypothetical protein
VGGGLLAEVSSGNIVLVPDEGSTEFHNARVTPPGTSVGRRVLVSGLAGAGKSTFSRALSAKTGLPLIHLDIHFWKPGWVEPTEDEWREKQRGLLSGDGWIIDGNYHATLDLRLERADTVVPRHAMVGLCTASISPRGSQASCRLPAAQRLRGVSFATVA